MSQHTQSPITSATNHGHQASILNIHTQIVISANDVRIRQGNTNWICPSVS